MVFSHSLLFNPIALGGLPMEINALVITLIVIIIFLSAVMLYREFSQLRNEKNALREENHELKVRIEKFEASSRKRIPYAVYEAMLDAMAGLDVEEREAQFHSNIRENIRAHIYRAMTIGTNREGEK